MPNKKRLIVFFVPPQKIISGGILSIFSVCSISREFYNIHKAKVIICVYPGYKSYKKNDLFSNSEDIHSFDEVMSWGTPEYLQIHLPEYASTEVFNLLSPHRKFLQSINDLHVNIMNQNVTLMPSPLEIANWFELTPKVTQTTAHDRYATQKLTDKYNLPTHHLSTYLDPKQYSSRTFNEKENIILLSPDEIKERGAIVKKLAKELPEYKLITVKNLRYEDYKDFASRAKFTITFGEGFDGYFLETCFSGGVAFAVYNDDFFPSKTFSKFENTYDSYANMQKNICNDINFLNYRALYKKIVQKNFDEISKFYSFSTYKNNLKEFYLNHFTLKPSQYSAERLMGSILNDKNARIKKLQDDVQLITSMYRRLEKSNHLQENKLGKISAISEERAAFIDTILNSASWKVTKPLRRVSSIGKPRGRTSAN
jgi:hypothetical protein